MRVWLDIFELRPAEWAGHKPQEALSGAGVVLACLGVHGPGSWSAVEMSSAGNQDRLVRVVTFPGWNADVGRLGHSQADELHDDWDGGLARLVDALTPIVPPARLTHPGPAGGPFAGSPYPGIDRSFGPEHAAWFFGRDTETASMIHALHEHRWVWLVGNSGSGKSSVARAGVMAWWPRAEAEPGLATVFEPTTRATEDLAGALDRALRMGGLEPVDTHVLAATPDGWSATLRARFGASPARRPILVVVDQAEQIFSPTAGLRGTSADMLTTLWSLANDAELPVRLHVLVVLRADWLQRALQEPVLAPMFSASHTQVTRLDMDDADVRKAIVLPARQASGAVDEPAVEALVRAVRDREHALPLLQLVLQDAWRHSPDRIIHLETIGTQPLEDAIGRLVSESAASAKVRLDDAQLDTLVTSLVELDDRDAPRRRWMRRAELDTRPDRDAIVQTLDVLVRARIVVGRTADDGDGWQFAHEAVLRSWGALVAAIRRRSQLLSLIAALRRLTREASLLHGATLRRYEVLLDEPSLDPPSRALLVASLAAEKRAAQTRQRRARTAVGALVVIAVMLGGMALVAVSRQRAADRERREARRLLAATLLEEGREAIIEDQEPLTAISYLTAAREQGADGPVIEMLFAQATRNLRIYRWPARGAHTSAYDPGDFNSVVAGVDARDMGIPGIALETGNYIVADAPLRSIAYSGDGSRIVTLTVAGTVQVWLEKTREMLGPAITHERKVVAVALAPDGKRILSTTEDGVTHVRDLSGGPARSPAVSHGGAVRIATFSPDGRYVATAGKTKGARVWNLETGQLASELATDMKVISMAFSPGSDRLVTGSDDWRARVWDPDDGTSLTGPMSHDAPVASAQFRGDGMAVLTVSGKTARLWDVTNGREIGEPMNHADTVNAATFSPDGLRIATASADRTARIWEAGSGRPLTAQLQHDAGVTSVAFSIDGAWLLTTGGDEAAEWDASTGHATAVPMTPDTGGRLAVFDERATRVLTVNGHNVVQVLELENGRPISPPLKLDAHVDGVALSSDGSRALTISSQRVDVWNLAADKPMATVEHAATIRGAVFSRDGSAVMTADSDGVARVWDARTGEPRSEVLAHEGVLSPTNLSADGAHVVAIGRDANVQIWSAGGAGKPATLVQKKGLLAALSPDGSRVLIADDGGSAAVWSLSDWRVPTAELDHGAPINTAAFSGDGKRVVTGGDDRTARVWDTGTGRPLLRPLDHEFNVRHAAFSADGTMIVTVSGSATVRIWDAATGQALSPPLAHDAFVMSAGFSSDGARVVARTVGLSSRVWDFARDRRSLPEWKRIADARGWSVARRPNQPIGHDQLVEDMLERVGNPGLADDLARASNLTGSAFSSLPRYPGLAALKAYGAIEIYQRRGGDGRVARMCLAIAELLEQRDVSAARAVLGTPASIPDAELVEQMADTAVEETLREELGAAIRDAARR